MSEAKKGSRPRTNGSDKNVSNIVIKRSKQYQSLSADAKVLVDNTLQVLKNWTEEKAIELVKQHNSDPAAVEEALSRELEVEQQWTEVPTRAGKKKKPVEGEPKETRDQSAAARDPSQRRPRDNTNGVESTDPSSSSSAARGGRGGARGGRGGSASGRGRGGRELTRGGAPAPSAPEQSTPAQQPKTGVPAFVVPAAFTGPKSYAEIMKSQDKKAQEAAQAVQAAEQARQAEIARQQREREEQERQAQEQEAARQRYEQEKAAAEAAAAAEAEAQRLRDQQLQEQQQQQQAAEQLQAEQQLQSISESVSNLHVTPVATPTNQQQSSEQPATLSPRPTPSESHKQEPIGSRASVSASQVSRASPTSYGAPGRGRSAWQPKGAKEKAADSLAIQHQPSPTQTLSTFTTTSPHDFSQHPQSSPSDLNVQQSTVSALYSADDPVILPQHLKDQTQYDAPNIHFGFGIRKPVEQPPQQQPFTNSLVSQEAAPAVSPAARFPPQQLEQAPQSSTPKQAPQQQPLNAQPEPLNQDVQSSMGAFGFGGMPAQTQPPQRPNLQLNAQQPAAPVLGYDNVDPQMYGYPQYNAPYIMPSAVPSFPYEEQQQLNQQNMPYYDHYGGQFRKSGPQGQRNLQGQQPQQPQQQQQQKDGSKDPKKSGSSSPTQTAQTAPDQGQQGMMMPMQPVNALPGGVGLQQQPRGGQKNPRPYNNNGNNNGNKPQGGFNSNKTFPKKPFTGGAQQSFGGAKKGSFPPQQAQPSTFNQPPTYSMPYGVSNYGYNPYMQNPYFPQPSQYPPGFGRPYGYQAQQAPYGNFGPATGYPGHQSPTGFDDGSYDYGKNMGYDPSLVDQQNFQWQQPQFGMENDGGFAPQNPPSPTPQDNTAKQGPADLDRLQQNPRLNYRQPLPQQQQQQQPQQQGYGSNLNQLGSVSQSQPQQNQQSYGYLPPQQYGQQGYQNQQYSNDQQYNNWN